NDDDAAAIEVIGLPFSFTFDDRRVIAVTGRDAWLTIRGRLPAWTSIFVRAGETVTVRGGAHTRYAYVAVSGGVATPPILGSRAAYLPAGIGRTLRAGDTLPLGVS